jgi:putative exporter of polyketide antibiotics
VLAALTVATTLLALAIFVGLVAARLPAAGSALLALATISPAIVFIGVGAVTSQLAPTRRGALELASAVLAGCFLLRVVADIGSGLRWLSWATPFGWSEELRAFADPRPAMLLLPLLTGALLVSGAGVIAARRDVGSGILHGRDSADADLRLLSSPSALAFRLSRGSIIAWFTGIGVFAGVVGLLSTSFTTADISANLRKPLEKLSGASITTPAGALGFYFLLFVLVISLYACSQLASIRREEADQQLETLFAQPLGRYRWLVDRLALATAGAAALALVAATLAWGRIGQPERPRLTAASGRGRSQLLPHGAPLPRARHPRPRTDTPGVDRSRLRPSHARVRLGAVRLTVRRTALDAQPDAVPAHRARPRAAVPRRSRRDHARDRCRCHERRRLQLRAPRSHRELTARSIRSDLTSPR